MAESNRRRGSVGGRFTVSRSRLGVETLEARLPLTAFTEPVELSSVRGVLDVTLEAHRSTQEIEVANPVDRLAPGIPTQVDGFMTYQWTLHAGRSSNGNMTGDNEQGPTLHVNPGDVLRIHLKNDLGDQPTNLHTHGLLIAPSGNSDNVLLSIPPGFTNTYEYRIPLEQEPGVNWYHPHRHGYTAEQVYRGLAGFLVIGSGNNDIDQVKDLPMRMMMVQAQSIEADAMTGRPTLQPLSAVDSGSFQVTINGQYMPDIAMQKETELWVGLQIDVRDLVRTFQPVSNNPADWDFNGTKSPNMDAFYVAQDGEAFPSTVGKARVALAPGKRVSEVISAPKAGETKYFVATVIQPTAPETEYTQAIARIQGYGQGGDPAAWKDRPLTSASMEYEDLSKLPVDVRRTVVFETRIVEGRREFLVNGEVYPNGPVFQPRAGQVEEWTVINKDPYPHPIHLHMQSFQAQNVSVGQNGYTIPPHFYDQDVWYMDSQTTSVFRIRWKPTLGESVFHCHNLFHEDGGMMAGLNVIPAQPYLVAADAQGGMARFYPLGSGDSERLTTVPAKVVQPFGAKYRDGMASAMGDVNFDGVPDATFAQARGGRVVVLDGASNFSRKLHDFFPFGPGYRYALNVAVGDVNGDSHSDLVLAGDVGADGTVKVYSGQTLSMLSQFRAYERNETIRLPKYQFDPRHHPVIRDLYRGGVELATGNVDGSGRVRIVTAPGGSHAPEVRVWGWDLFRPNQDLHGASLLGAPRRVTQFLASSERDRGGLSLATTYYGGQFGGSLRIVTAPRKDASRASVWRLSAAAHAMGSRVNHADHVHFAEPESHDEAMADADFMAEMLATLEPRPGRKVRAGFDLASVSTPTGSLVTLTPRGEAHAPVWAYSPGRTFAPTTPQVLTLGRPYALKLAGS